MGQSVAPLVKINSSGSAAPSSVWGGSGKVSSSFATGAGAMPSFGSFAGTSPARGSFGGGNSGKTQSSSRDGRSGDQDSDWDVDDGMFVDRSVHERLIEQVNEYCKSVCFAH